MNVRLLIAYLERLEAERDSGWSLESHIKELLDRKVFDVEYVADEGEWADNIYWTYNPDKAENVIEKDVLSLKQALELGILKKVDDDET